MSGEEEESIPMMMEIMATTPVTETPVMTVALITVASVTYALYLPGQPFPVFYTPLGFSQQGVKTFQGRMLPNPYPSFPLIPPQCRTKQVNAIESEKMQQQELDPGVCNNNSTSLRSRIHL
ncbi:UNVERIFIED_CONTAM: hypothetical protein K2H54_044453 [Gekko kuhli]